MGKICIAQKVARLAFRFLISTLIVGIALVNPTHAQGRIEIQFPLTSRSGRNHPILPVSSLINPDGSLNLQSGLRGILDARGWRMTYAFNGSPTFEPEAPGDEYWVPDFSLPGVNSTVNALLVDSSGNLYVAGSFVTAGGLTVNRIARWDGTVWAALGTGTSNTIRALAMDTAGNLYAAGDFLTAGGVTVNRIAMWDGTSWSALGTGLNNNAMALAFDPNGNLYVGGQFTTAGGVTANRIAIWDGTNWSTPGTGMNNTVYALSSDNSGNIYAGGAFTDAGGTLANRVALWDGSAWSALAAGLNGTVRALALDNSGYLSAGGSFTTAGGNPANRIARWDGSAWTALGSGLNNTVYALLPDSSGNMYVAGGFTNAGGAPASRIALWNGASWSTFGIGMNSTANALALHPSGRLYVGGGFSSAGGLVVNRITYWDGLAWQPLGWGVSGTVYAMFLDGNGNLYVGGSFTNAGGKPANRIARWDGSAWSNLGSGLNNTVRALAMDSAGNLYAGGSFTTAGGLAANRIARWDGSNWSPLGSGTSSVVYALSWDGSGNLFAGGAFTTAGGVPANRIARWDGSAWYDLGAGLGNTAYALLMDGVGNLYAGGAFTTAGGTPANRVARWNGTSWSALGSGVNNAVNALAFDSNGNLYAGGTFTSAGGNPASRLARWDGASWNALGAGVNNTVSALAIDSANNLYAGGSFITAGGITVNRIARWNGTAWSELGSGIDNTVYALQAVPNRDVYAGGQFTQAGGKYSARFALWLNAAPWAEDDAYTTDEDTPLNVPAPGVLSNDGDPSSDPIIALPNTPPTHGSLTLNQDGSFVYTPSQDYHGTDSFTYLASDMGKTDGATVVITITPVNDTPVANNDTAMVMENTVLTVPAPGVMGNDLDPDGDILTATLDTSPANGTLAFLADGSYIYTPTLNFNGIDGFTYHVTDGVANSNTASVSITVYQTNDPPVANDDTGVISEDTLLVVPTPGVLGNDTDPDLNPLTAVLDSAPLSGTLTLNPNGSYSYLPDANFNGTDMFTYHAYDGALPSNIATVTITVTAVNDPPVANNDVFLTDEETPLVLPAAGVLTNDTDVDLDPLTAILDNGPDHGTLWFNTDGSFVYTPTLNYHGIDSFTYLAHDGAASSNVATVQITINPVNDPPVAMDDYVSTVEDVTLVITGTGVLTNDYDIDGDPLGAILDTPPAFGVADLGIDGSLVYTPALDFNGVDSFTYHAFDGLENSNIATVVITVTAANDPPLAVDDIAVTDEDTLLVVAAPGVLSNDSDIDGDPIYAVLENGPGNGTLTLNQDGSFTYMPDADFNGNDSFTYHANDGLADSNSATVTITVNPVNDPPVANDDTASTPENTVLIVPAPGVLANDTDLENDPLTAILVNGPANGAVNLIPDGGYIYTPTLNFNGVDSFTYQADDGQLSSNVATVTIYVGPVNNPPVANGDTANTDEDTALVVPAPGVLANDTDPDNDPLTAVLDSGPANGTVTLNPDGSYTYTPALNYFGTDSFTYHAFDGVAGSNIATVDISVNPINDPPQADAGADQTVPEASLVAFNGSYTDPDDRLGQAELRLPSLLPTALIAWDFGDGTFASGTLTPTHTYAENGSFVVTLVVTDSLGESGSDSLVVTVENVAPLVNAGPDGTVHMGDAFVSSGSFTDPGPDTHTATVDYGDGSGVQPLNLNGQSFNLNHIYTYPGYYTLRVNVTDDDGGVGTDTVVVTVTPLSDLILEKDVSQDSVLAGGELGFTLTVTNNGPSTTAGVQVVDVLPAGLTFISASPGCTANNQVVTCDLGLLTALASQSVVISTRVSLDSTGLVTNSASVTGDEVDPYPDNNLATSSATVLSTLTVYEQDFETNDTYPEWDGCTTPITTTSPSGQNYLGEYVNETACLLLPGLLDHSHVIVSFDLYIVRSWDGNEVHRPLTVAGYMPYSPEQTIGPDEWLFNANGKSLLHTTFANWDWQTYGFHQAYPDDYPWGSNPALTGATQVNSLGYYFSTIPMDAVYHLTFTFRQGDQELSLDFGALGLQDLSDESWGVDNLTVVLSHGVGIPPEIIYLPVIFR